MKKILIVSALVLGFAAAAAAQPRAIGARLGYGVELSYQHLAGTSDFMEFDLGLAGKSLNLAASYNKSISQFGNGFNFYAGPSAAVGLGFNPGWFGVGVGANVGLEYEFDFPLQLSIDIRPQLGLTFIEGVHLNYWGYPSLGVRYAF